MLLLPHLSKLLPLLSQLQWQVTSMQLKALAVALSSCCSTPASTSKDNPSTSTKVGTSSSSRAQQASHLQLLLTLCTDADYAADAVDTVHEGLGYCLLASLTEPQCWPSRADPSAAVAAAAATAAEMDGASPAEVAAAECMTELMQSAAAAEQHGQQLFDLPLFAQELNLLHGCLPAVPLPAFWAVGSLNRASGSIAAAGAALVASAGASATARGAELTSADSSNEQQAEQGAEAPGAATAAESAVPTTGTAAVAAAGAVRDWLHSMALLELQYPLLLRPLQLQHSHLLKAGAALVGSNRQGIDPHSDAQPAAVAPTPAGGRAAEPRGVAAVLQDVSHVLAVALESTGCADAADADADGMPGALSAAAVSRLRDGAEAAGGYLAAAGVEPSGVASSTAAELVLGLVNLQEQQQQNQAVHGEAQGSARHGQQCQHSSSVLLQLWQCVAVDLIDSSRLLDLVQQITGAFHGSENALAQQLHDRFLQQLREALLQLPQQQFDQLLLLQLGTRDAFAANSSGVCRELWQQLLSGGDGGSAGAAVQLLQRLLAACLRLTFGRPQTETAGSSSSRLSKKQLAAVGSLLGVVVQGATALGLPGVLACLSSLEALAAAVAGHSETTHSSSSGSSDGGKDASQSGQPGASDSDSITQRLIPFLPLLLFVQRVVVQSSRSQGSIGPTPAKGSKRSDNTQGSGLLPASRSEVSEGGILSDSSSAELPHLQDATGEGSAQPQQQQGLSSEGSDASTAGVLSTGSFGGAAEAAAGEAAAAGGVVLQDDAVQVLGGAAASAAMYDDDEDFLDEFEDEDEYLTQVS
mgnify:CR=1 FL=1